MATLSCKHYTIGNVTSASCSICGSLKKNDSGNVYR